VVQIIENEEEAGGAKFIRFRVHPSKRTPGEVLGSWQHAMEPTYPKGPAAVLGNKLGTPAVIEFQNAVAAAHEDGIPFVWIDDPDGLFPPADRPTFQIVPP
jgi:hypothetical protein